LKSVGDTAPALIVSCAMGNRRERQN